MKAPAAFDGPAGLYRRSVAWSIDAALLLPLAVMLTWRWTAPAALEWAAQARALMDISGQAMGAAVIGGMPTPELATALMQDATLTATMGAMHAASWGVLLPPLAAFALLGAVYHVCAECSVWRASPGKRLLGLRVGGQHGQRLTPARALLRHAASTLSWLTFNLGHALAGIAPQHLALHDRCSGTRVVGGAGPLPRWVPVWLALVAMAALGAVVWLAGRAVELMRIALERALY